MKKFVTRYYNSLELINDKIIKTCSLDRVKKETDWFTVAKKDFPEHIPEIYSIKFDDKGKFGSFEMEYIEGDNLFDWVNRQTSLNTAKNVFQELLDIYKNKIHIQNKVSNYTDIEHMYFEKPLEALRYYSNNINGNHEKYIINNEVFLHPKYILKEKFEKLKSKLTDTTFTLIHGDATFSNTLISKESDHLYLIDPRGGFGTTNFYGDPRYDLAKLYYSIRGNFDSLNNGLFSVNQIKNKYSYEIQEIPFAKELEQILFNEINEEKILVEFIHATIWLSLVPHLQNNEKQMLTAFLHGTKLINKIRV